MVSGVCLSMNYYVGSVGDWFDSTKACQAVGMNHPVEVFVAPGPIKRAEAAWQSSAPCIQTARSGREEPHWCLNSFQPPQVWFLPYFTVSAGTQAKATQSWICSWCSSCSHCSSLRLWVGPSEELRPAGKFGAWSASWRGGFLIQWVASITTPPIFARIIKTHFFPLAQLGFAMLVVPFSLFSLSLSV